ncbi:MAG: hypothetical protein K0R17_924 [Rariglobus sp.]|jgi:hypothetical protein|nr:hypothetical protein [Rariglobus sp.]
MPSPRDILLARHGAAEPRLDVLRATVLARVEPTLNRRASLLTTLRAVWRELVVPCRPVWMTLAAVWAVLLVLNGTGRSRGEAPVFSANEITAAMTQWVERRRVLAELAAPAATPARKPPEAGIPGHSHLPSVTATTRSAC